MKKLVVLALVLAVSCVANAGLTMSVTGGTGAAGAILPGDVLTLNLVNSGLYANFGATILINGEIASIDIAGATNGQNAGAVADYSAAAPDFGVKFIIVADLASSADPTPALPAGNVVAGIKLVAGNVGTFDISVQNLDAPGGAFTFDAQQFAVVTPEPMTLGLLGLGGLFLRRRLA